MNNIVMDEVINVESNSTLRLNISKPSNKEITYNLDDNATLIINKKYDKCEEETININLNGIGSSVIYNFSTKAISNEKFTINIMHNNKNTKSKILNHGVVLNDSRLLFIVNTKVKKGNTGSILDQESKIIIMGENNSEIKPNLFIDEFDVDARHAASIGKFNNDDIFYLMTKGISYDKAIELLVNGFLNIGGDL